MYEEYNSKGQGVSVLKMTVFSSFSMEVEWLAGDCETDLRGTDLGLASV